MVTTQQVLANLQGYPRVLQWTDFRNVNSSPNPPASAQTASRYSWSVGPVVLQTDGHYRFGSVGVTIQLDTGQTWKDLSWFNSASTQEKDRLLEHEQGHYHITGLLGRDLCRELLSMEMNDEIVAVLRGVGDSPQARLAHASPQLQAAAGTKGQEADRLYRWLENTSVGGVPREGQYERDTGHGTLAQAQRKWTDMFAHARNNDTALSLLLTMHGCGSGLASTLGTCVANTSTP